MAVILVCPVCPDCPACPCFTGRVPLARPLILGLAGHLGHSGHSKMDELGEHIIALIGVILLTIGFQIIEWWSVV